MTRTLDKVLEAEQVLRNEQKVLEGTFPNLRDFGLDRREMYEEAHAYHQSRIAEIVAARETLLQERMALIAAARKADR